MKVRLKKTKDGRPSITAVRPDGSSTTGRLGAGDFGPVHDLAHYAVETSLGLRQGFYGLLASGWNFPDFEARGAGERFPDESIVAECLAAQLGAMVLSKQDATAGEFNWLVRQAATAVRPGAQVPELDEAARRRLREQFDALLARWRGLPAGETLELDYPA